MPRAPFCKYLAVSPEDRKWQVYCIDAGATEVEPGSPYPPYPDMHPPRYCRNWEQGRILDELQVCYITRGKGWFKSTDGRLRSVEAGTAILFFPGVWHWLAPDPHTGWDEFWVGFEGTYPHALLREGFFSPEEPLFSVGFHDSLVQRFLDIDEIVTKAPPAFQFRAGASVIQILAELVSLRRQKQQGSRAEAIVQQAKMIFEANRYHLLDMESVAESLGVGYTHFLRIFRDYTGLSPYQYFLQIKIRLAKALLHQGETSVKEVASLLAFDNPYYFSRLFKKKTGMAPTEWWRASRNPAAVPQRKVY